MGETTGIAWTDMTFNPWIGCTKVSQGCKFCYAETQNKRYGWVSAWGPNAPRKRTSEANWRKPLEWAKKAASEGVTRRVFCASLADVFDIEAPQEWRVDLFTMIDQIGRFVWGLEWLILTKRPENIINMAPARWLDNPPDYVRIGVTSEDQENADKRIPELLKVWHGRTFVSYEPALSPVDFSPYLVCQWFQDTDHPVQWKPGDIVDREKYPIRGYSARLRGRIDWVICGGESGPGCRPMDLQWARDVRDQCRAANTPFFFKQIGGHPNKRHDPALWPADLRVQEFPTMEATK
jgi:protein gp37